MFKDEKKTAHLQQTKLVVETREATAGLVIAQDGRPLSLQQERAEELTLEAYAHNPEELSKKRKQEKEDADRTEKILRAIPDAFLFEADGAEPGTASVGREGHELTRLKFRPNPSYTPPSRVEQVLTGMSGHILIDEEENHIAEIDGTLQKEVGFGWGILGHLDRGGRFLVQQADVGDHHWEATRMELSFTGKVLLFKKLNIRSVDVFSNFHLVPGNLTFAEGVEMLEKESGQMQAGQSRSNPGQFRNDIKLQAREEAEEGLCCSQYWLAYGRCRFFLCELGLAVDSDSIFEPENPHDRVYTVAALRRTVSFLTVSLSIRPRLISYPVPVASLTAIVPRALTSISGSTTSSAQ